jgi:phospholipid transport system substrate-binding protein
MTRQCPHARPLCRSEHSADIRHGGAEQPPLQTAFPAIRPREYVTALCVALVLIAALIFPRYADSIADTNPAASAYMQEFAAESLKELTDPTLPQAEREQRFRRLLVGHFNLTALSKFVLGRYWRSTTDSQRAAFKTAFEDFLVHSYAARFGEYYGMGFDVIGAANGANGVVIVHSKIHSAKAEDVSADWHLITSAGSFEIVDIFIEGVSMAVTQRSEFGSIIQSSGGIDGLIAVMRAKNSEAAGAKPVR